jgi:hypothetical protein
MSQDENQIRKQKVFRAVMLGLACGSGTFLVLRYLLRLEVDPSLIAGTGVGISIGLFFLQRITQR